MWFCLMKGTRVLVGPALIIPLQLEPFLYSDFSKSIKQCHDCYVFEILLEHESTCDLDGCVVLNPRATLLFRRKFPSS